MPIRFAPMLISAWMSAPEPFGGSRMIGLDCTLLVRLNILIHLSVNTLR